MMTSIGHSLIGGHPSATHAPHADSPGVVSQATPGADPSSSPIAAQPVHRPDAAPVAIDSASAAPAPKHGFFDGIRSFEHSVVNVFHHGAAPQQSAAPAPAAVAVQSTQPMQPQQQPQSAVPAAAPATVTLTSAPTAGVAAAPTPVPVNLAVNVPQNPVPSTNPSVPRDPPLPGQVNQRCSRRSRCRSHKAQCL